MNKYEAMFIIRPDLSEDAKKTLFSQLNDMVVKHNGKVLAANVWSEKRKLTFTIKKCQEGLYYLMHFNIEPLLLKEISPVFKINENILRLLITRINS